MHAQPATTSPGDPAAEIAAMITAVERYAGVRLCVYDYSGRLSAVTPPDHNHHNHPFCRHIIRQNAPCGAFDGTQVEKIVAQHPAGFLKRCHGDVLEFAVPIRDGDAILGVALAGPFAPMKGRDPETLALRSPTRLPLNEEGQKLYRHVPPLTPEIQRDLPPLMRAFASRVEALVVRAGSVTRKDLRRKWQIENLLARRFAQNLSLLDLSQELNVSASRARHLVVELFGRRFSELLRAQRLAYAKYLLTQTSLSVQQIAARCGFCDANHFHKTFRRIERRTPQMFRKQHVADAHALSGSHE